jgi:hypothetical protein
MKEGMHRNLIAGLQTDTVHVCNVLLQHLKIRHILDIMLCDKNLCDNTVKTVIGENNYD